MQVAGEAELKDHRIPLEKGRERGWGRVSIPADANPADNDYWFVFEQPAARRTIIVVDDPQAARPLTLAASISPDPALQCTAEVVRSEPGGGDRLGPGLAAPVAGRACPSSTRPSRFGRSSSAADRSSSFRRGRPAAARCSGCGSRPGPNEKAGIPVVSWRGDEDLLAHTASGAPLPVGALEVRKYCGLSGDVTALATLRDGPPLLARAATDHGAVYFCATTPAPADSSLATGGVVFYVLVQRALASGAVALGSTRQLRPATDSGRPDAVEARFGGRGSALDGLLVSLGRLRGG